MARFNNSEFIHSDNIVHQAERFENFPADTSVFVRMNKIIKRDPKNTSSIRLSHHMVKCASVLPIGEYIGWQMMIPKKGTIKMALFGTGSMQKKDLEWMLEGTAKCSGSNRHISFINNNKNLYEFYLPIAFTQPQTLGFNAPLTDNFSKWPTAYSSQFSELVEALRQEGAFFRVVVGAATEDEQMFCRKHTLNTIDSNRIDTASYIGKPVKASVLFLLSNTPSLRLKSVLDEAIPGARLNYIGNMKDYETQNIWNNPLQKAEVLPDYAARIMIMEPELKESIVGIEACEESMKRIPASHKAPKPNGAVIIGKAEDVTGIKRKMTIGELDLRRHYQIVGQTGCGKSTLLTSIILSAIEQGHGLTFFDPHGTTIDTILRCVPEKHAHKIRVVRIGDAENPVPLNIWDSDDPIKEERNISDLAELFMDLFDPYNQGWVGPRYERWLSTFAKASIAFLGKRASLESIAVISQSKDNMKKVADAISKDYPDLYETIKNEYGLDNSTDFHAVLSWYLCKFQRICSVEQLRKTLGGGANALDFNHNIDKDTVTLIDLASPTIGTHAARIVGTLTLMKLWNAAITRQNRDKTHLIVLDEASLFQTNPLPRILSEGRKFGIACVLCHQHTAQLTSEIRDSLEANSANFSAFRLSTKDAANAAIRFDNPEIITSLTRLDAFNAITTLSVDGQQTAPFTLETIRPRKQKNAEALAAKIEQNSIDKLVKAYESYRAITPKEIVDMLNNPNKRTALIQNSSAQKVSIQKDNSLYPNTKQRAKSESSFLSEWEKYKSIHPITTKD